MKMHINSKRHVSAYHAATKKANAKTNISDPVQTAVMYKN